MIASLILPLLLQSAPMQEAPPVPGWNCEDPRYQQEMNWCAAQDYVAADAELNAQWKITAAAMKAQDASFAEYGDNDIREGFFESLLEAQRGWLRYRDAHCRLDGYTARGGSMEPMLASFCKANLTRLRTAELKALVETPG
ncbi:lysozyme inhibitor LprI family protein [Porphyrobacter sp. AAP60]|uniref:lysozyme inhibitor LprI family protein n=1 Tax=Porphyrobacter sp. AAP60 TaxID=1523423 RepID=UPI0009E8FE67|nr:lysozyme inhibitor LprI family protein [Porphyrobacter sp. AAP60]